MAPATQSHTHTVSLEGLPLPLPYIQSLQGPSHTHTCSHTQVTHIHMCTRMLCAPARVWVQVHGNGSGQWVRGCWQVDFPCLPGLAQLHGPGTVKRDWAFLAPQLSWVCYVSGYSSKVQPQSQPVSLEGGGTKAIHAGTLEDSMETSINSVSVQVFIHLVETLLEATSIASYEEVPMRPTIFGPVKTLQHLDTQFLSVDFNSTSRNVMLVYTLSDKSGFNITTRFTGEYSQSLAPSRLGTECLD